MPVQSPEPSEPLTNSAMRIGVVVIGRNEGERLRRCLLSLRATTEAMVYVDSGSSDGSTRLASDIGAHVVELDLSQPFTAARARNAGFARLMEVSPKLDGVQFVDGDCEIVPGWMEAASRFLRVSPAYAVVCGRRRERYPERSVYNRLCDEEWDTPVGDARSCGGDALMRTSAFTAVGGYRDDLIAGEEPELCLRLRQAGWKIYRLPEEMTLHDAAIYRFGQWWKRSMRSGHAYGEGSWLHGASAERHWVAETRRALMWGTGIPVLIATASLLLSPWCLLLLAVYPLQLLRVWLTTGSLTTSWFLLLSKFAESLGIVQFHWARLLGQRKQIIEYKTP